MSEPNSPIRQLAPVLGIALPLVLALCFAVDRTFVDDPAARSILAAEERVFQDLESSHELLDQLIAGDEVTWDPTNGALIGKVLANLKRAEGSKLLIVGSSQMLVVRDDRSYAGIATRVDKVLDDRLGDQMTVYNLSLGGMTLIEKSWVLEQAADRVDFDFIVVGMTLWDSVSDEVRPALAGSSAPSPDPHEETAAADGWPDPAAINGAITSRFTATLEETVPFFAHRSAIQRWLELGIVGTLDDAETPGEALTQAEPVRYAYNEQQQSLILDRVRGFLTSLQALGSRSDATIMVILTPYRQDPHRPAYSPPVFYDQFRELIAQSCARDRFLFLDASSLLGGSHFGIYADGPDVGRIDVLHFDGSGHGLLADAIERSELFAPQQRSAMFSMGSSRETSPSGSSRP